MAPHPGIETESIKEQARKDLLNLLEGVCKACLFPYNPAAWLLRKDRYEERRTL